MRKKFRALHVCTSPGQARHQLGFRDTAGYDVRTIHETLASPRSNLSYDPQQQTFLWLALIAPSPMGRALSGQLCTPLVLSIAAE